jgi:hypothetical protein
VTDIGNHCVNCTTSINLPFHYYLYNSWYYVARASSNGNLQFIYANTSNSPECLPAPNFDATIFAMWTAMRTDCAGCGIFISWSGNPPNRTFNIEWRAVLVTGSYPVNFQIRLYEGQRKFDIVYNTTGNDGAGTVIGVEGSSTLYTSYTCYSRRQLQGVVVTFTLPECAITPTSTPFDSRTPSATRTPTVTATPSNTPVPAATCGPNAHYLITTSSGGIEPGTNDVGIHCDDCATSINLPFTYNFYGQPYNSALVSSNGFLQFMGNATNQYVNTCLPNPVLNNAILGHWDDLVTNYYIENGIFTSVSGAAPNRIFNIEWRTSLFASNGPVNFEIRLYEGQNRFDIVYGVVNSYGNGATVGVQRDTGPVYTQYMCNSGGLAAGLLLIFSQPDCGTPTSTVTGTPPTATATNTATGTRTGTPTNTRTFTRTATRTTTPTNTPNTNTGYAYFAPSSPLTVTLGTTFTLDLMVHADNYNAAAQQSYLTFTNSLLQVSDAGAAGCVPTNTVSADTSTFDAVLQNDVCNGSQPCDFDGRIAPPGSIGFASGALSNPPSSGDFRIAGIAFCANAMGTARLHWQFSPPAPNTRDTEILDGSGVLVSNPALYTDYTVRVVQNANANLQGHVIWQGRPAQPNALQQLPVTLTLKLGTTEVNYTNLTTDANGLFTVPVGALSPGTYNWRVKGSKHLANGGSVTLNGVSNTGVEMGTLRVGDCNNDNLVTAGDFIILRNSYGLGSGDPGYDDRAEFTGDGIVNIFDFNPMKVNFGSGGVPPARR